MKALRIVSVVLWTLALLAGAGAAYLYLVPRTGPTDAGPAVYAMPFTLVNQDGETVTEADFLGRPSAWFYGFTHCPDVCPTALSEMSALLETLGPDAGKLQVVFVSVDPERDDVATMKNYVDYFDDRIVGLTGDLNEVSAMAKARYIFFEKVPLDGGDYAVDHSASVHLADASGFFFGTLDGEEPFDTRLKKLRRLIK